MERRPRGHPKVGHKSNYQPVKRRQQEEFWESEEGRLTSAPAAEPPGRGNTPNEVNFSFITVGQTEIEAKKGDAEPLGAAQRTGSKKVCGLRVRKINISRNLFTLAAAP